MALRRLVLVRHGETEGASSVRFHGASDVTLSDLGCAQLEQARATLRARGHYFERVVASTLQRSWEGARIVADGAPVRLDNDFREVDIGRWEGLTRDEIRALEQAVAG